jgi:hypothetical protein
MSIFDLNHEMVMVNELENEIENDLFVATMVQLLDKLDQEGYYVLALEDAIPTPVFESPDVETEEEQLNPSTRTQAEASQAPDQSWKDDFLCTFDQVRYLLYLLDRKVVFLHSLVVESPMDYQEGCIQ